MEHCIIAKKNKTFHYLYTCTPTVLLLIEFQKSNCKKQQYNSIYYFSDVRAIYKTSQNIHTRCPLLCRPEGWTDNWTLVLHYAPNVNISSSGTKTALNVNERQRYIYNKMLFLLYTVDYIVNNYLCLYMKSLHINNITFIQSQKQTYLCTPVLWVQCIINVRHVLRVFSLHINTSKQ